MASSVTMQSMHSMVQSSMQSTVPSVQHVIDRKPTATHDGTNTNNSEENHATARRSPRLSLRRGSKSQPNASPLQALRSSFRSSKKSTSSRVLATPPPAPSHDSNETPETTSPKNNTDAKTPNPPPSRILSSPMRTSLRTIRNAFSLRIPRVPKEVNSQQQQQHYQQDATTSSQNNVEALEQSHETKDPTLPQKSQSQQSLSSMNYMPEEIPHAPTDETLFQHSTTTSHNDDNNSNRPRRRPSILEHLNFGLATADYYFQNSVFQRRTHKEGGDGTVVDDYDDDEEEEDEVDFTSSDHPASVFAIRKQASTSTEESSSSCSRYSNNSTAPHHNAQTNSGSTTVPHFPPEVALGSVSHCYSTPPCERFCIRGPDYLKTRKKIPSQEFLFPTRGMDIFLSTNAPVNVGANPRVLDGKLRTVPSFVINFQVAWGNVIFYFEIPKKFVPYLRAGQERPQDPATIQDYLRKVDESSSLLPSEKSLCRFLLQDNARKNAVLKILPHVKQGPWVARMACQKPALIGKVIPIEWEYHAGDDDRAPYLEADFNINSSSAAKPILQVARSCTKSLTLDLGFVVQGNTADELPEQMLVGCRLHAINPDAAPAFPAEEEAASMQMIASKESFQQPPLSDSTLPSFRSESSDSMEDIDQ